MEANIYIKYIYIYIQTKNHTKTSWWDVEQLKVSHAKQGFFGVGGLVCLWGLCVCAGGQLFCFPQTEILSLLK